ncbi:MAG: signal peptidase I [Actinophytocola sp.]|nr:signal peptidase I [Actinophytocola sp.]
MSIKHRETTRARGKMRPVRLLGALMVVLMVAAWWSWLRPESLGGSLTLVTVDGVSMEPGMHTGDLAIVQKTGDYAPGDVIAFRVPHRDGRHSAAVIHRIIGGDSATGFQMRGDNNDWDDPWRPRDTDIVGELLWHIPGAGSVVKTLADPVVAAGFLAALTAFMIIAGDKRGPDSKTPNTPKKVT